MSVQEDASSSGHTILVKRRCHFAVSASKVARSRLNFGVEKLFTGKVNQALSKQTARTTIFMSANI